MAALGRLSDQRADIDRSNVYPVADGDTGTNLLLTLEAGAAAVEGLVVDDLAEVATVFAHATLLGARGSSGVILAQIVRGWAEVLTEQAGDRTRPAVGAEVVAAALRRGAEGAFAAVGRPVEGTMLTVARAAADGAVGTTLSEVVTAAAAAGRAALARTPDQLEVLAAAGVVDAGGSGLVVLLDVLAEVVTGARSVRRRPRPGRRPSTAVSAASAVSVTPDVRRTSAVSVDHADEPGRGAYEVMYLLDATAEAVAGLRSRLDVLGDSLVVVGGDRLWNVHVHTDHVAAAIQAGIDVGRPHQLSVTRFADGEPGGGVPGSPPVVLLATASGPGLAAVLIEGGARLVGRLGRPVTAAELLAALRAVTGAAVVVLPDGTSALALAQAAAAAAGAEGRDVAVLPTRSPVQALAALAVHDPLAARAQDLVRMAAAAAATRHGAVTTADVDALTSAGWCRAGQVLGLVEDDVVEVGDDAPAVALSVASRMLAAGGELLTLVWGAAPGSRELADAVSVTVRRERKDVEVSVVDGGQRAHALLLGVE